MATYTLLPESRRSRWRGDLTSSVPVSEAYREWLEQGVSDDELIAIRQHLQQERAFGSKRFQAMAEKTLGRPVHVRRPGRPSHAEADGAGT